MTRNAPTRPGASFSRRSRLTKAADYRWVFAEPSKSSDRYFTVLARARDTDALACRLGLAVSRKSARRAVDRNRIKRLARERFRLGIGRCDDLSLDFVIIARSSAAQASATVLTASLNRHFALLADRHRRARFASCATFSAC